MSVPPIKPNNYSYIDSDNMYQFSIRKSEDNYFQNKYLKSADTEIEFLLTFDIDYLREQAFSMIMTTDDVKYGTPVKNDFYCESCCRYSRKTKIETLEKYKMSIKHIAAFTILICIYENQELELLANGNRQNDGLNSPVGKYTKYFNDVKRTLDYFERENEIADLDDVGMEEKEELSDNESCAESIHADSDADAKKANVVVANDQELDPSGTAGVKLDVN